MTGIERVLWALVFMSSMTGGFVLMLFVRELLLKRSNPVEWYRHRIRELQVRMYQCDKELQELLFEEDER